MLARVTRASSSAEVLVGFPYTFTISPFTEEHQAYDCVIYQASLDGPVETEYQDHCPISLTSPGSTPSGIPTTG